MDVSSDPRYQFFVNESSFSLDLPNLIVQDEGQYELRVENTIGVGSVPFNITVECEFTRVPVIKNEVGASIILYSNHSSSASSLVTAAYTQGSVSFLFSSYKFCQNFCLLPALLYLAHTVYIAMD